MSKSTDTEIKDLIGSVDRKLDLLTQKVSTIEQDVSTIKGAIDKLDSKVWTFGGLILAACLAALFRALDI